MKPVARAIVGNLIWSTDGGVWALLRVDPFAHAHTAHADKMGVHAQLRGLLMTLPSSSMLLSVCQRLSPFDVVDRMVEGIDLETHPAWDAVCGVTAEWMGAVALRRRRYYVAAKLEDGKPSWKKALKDGFADVGSAFGLSPRAIPAQEIEENRRQARALERRFAQQVRVTVPTAGEVCWLYARSLRRELDEPAYDLSWEPPVLDEALPIDGEDHPGDLEQAEARRPRGVLAHLTDVVVKEGGYPDDQDRPRHRRYVRVDSEDGAAYQTVLAMSDMPHYFRYPGGGGEWLFHADQVGFPVDWCVRVRSLPNADAQSKVRRKQRDLIGQVEEYDGEVSGAPPQLAEAIRSIGSERDELGANPAEPELQVTVLLSIAAPTLAELEEQAGALKALFEPEEYGLARPTGGQGALLRSMLPGTEAASVCRDYTQFMLTRDLAAGAPFCGFDVGDPAGLLLGVSLDDGNGTPVLFDPAFGPRVNASPSLAAVGRLGSGKSFFLKRLCWDTVARGGQVVTIDRTHSGEYAKLAEATPGRTQVVRLEAGAETRLDPMRTFSGDQRTAVTLGFLSLLAGSSTQSDEGAALAEAVDTVAEREDASLFDVLAELQRMGNDAESPDASARGLARRLSQYANSSTGKIAFGEGTSLGLDADFTVFWAPNLSLADRETMMSEQAARLLLPEQVLGQALLYLIAAVGRQVVFHDPRRFAAALYDEAWALLASPFGQQLLIEGVRDGRKHNGAIWLASQHPNDFAVSELEDLLGSKFVFSQARQAIPASLQFLGVDDSMAAAGTLQQGLETGSCLYRDVRDRVGLIQVLPPALPELDEVFNTAPNAAGLGPGALEGLASGGEDLGELAPGAVAALGTPRERKEGAELPPTGWEPESEPELETLEGVIVGGDTGETEILPVAGLEPTEPDVVDAELVPVGATPTGDGDGSGAGGAGHDSSKREEDDSTPGAAPSPSGPDPRALARARARSRRKVNPLAQALAEGDGE